MQRKLAFAVRPAAYDDGTPEERATFGTFSIWAGHDLLSGGFDFYRGLDVDGPLVPGYRAAEWLLWNFWRILWEPRADTPEWGFAHAMSSIGEGYRWPNVSFESDGVAVIVAAAPSVRRDAKPFRFTSNARVIMPVEDVAASIHEFARATVTALDAAGVHESNVHALLRDVQAEQADPALARRRRLEALLGREPGPSDDPTVDGLLADAAVLGDAAVDEIAAEPERDDTTTRAITADAIAKLSQTSGYVAESTPRSPGFDMPNLRARAHRNGPAWQIGAEAASRMRADNGLADEPMDDERLVALAGTSLDILDDVRGSRLSFVFDDHGESRIVLRSKWRTGRRFDLARLVGDRLFGPDEPLRPATRSFTYRQKAQRAFAAELLSPFDAVESFLRGDLSEEAQEDAARAFQVSPLTINSLLRNHGLLAAAGEFEVFE